MDQQAHPGCVHPMLLWRLLYEDGGDYFHFIAEDREA